MSTLQGLVLQNNFQNPNIGILAQQINILTESCNNGEITKAEYLELVNDIQRQISIHADMEDLSAMETLNTAINGLLTIASAI